VFTGPPVYPKERGGQTFFSMGPKGSGISTKISGTFNRKMNLPFSGAISTTNSVVVGTGVQFHYHADGWTLQYHGSKAWFFWPPGQTPRYASEIMAQLSTERRESLCSLPRPVGCPTLD
jgi:hypothetical protein